eukprot:scaffold984_cov281-Chaetoceros_neogracile.AAC.24
MVDVLTPIGNGQNVLIIGQDTGVGQRDLVIGAVKSQVMQRNSYIRRSPLNAGEEGAVVVGELIKEGVPIAMGFDAQNGIFEAAIIDPTKVTRTGTVDAASVAGLLTTSEARRWNGRNGNVK